MLEGHAHEVPTGNTERSSFLHTICCQTYVYSNCKPCCLQYTLSISHAFWWLFNVENRYGGIPHLQKACRSFRVFRHQCQIQARMESDKLQCRTQVLKLLDLYCCRCTAAHAVCLKACQVDCVLKTILRKLREPARLRAFIVSANANLSLQLISLECV